MGNNKPDMQESQSIVAIVQEEDRLKAVELKQEDGFFEVLWTKCTEAGNLDWQTFAAECGMSVVTTKKAKSHNGKMSVVGLWSTSVVFYRIDAPAVGLEETESIVKMQAEIMMPLPVDQMKMAWRRGRAQNGQTTVTIAAARTERLQLFAEKVGSFKPAKILLDCEGIVSAWKSVFSGREKDAVVVSITSRRSQVCLVQDGKLSNAVMLDIGLEDFLEAAHDIHMELVGQTAVAERFSQDMRSVLESLGHKEQITVPVIVLSDGDPAIESMVSCLQSAGIDARVALPMGKSFRTQAEFGVQQLYEYRVPVGLGLMTMETPSDGLDLFADLYTKAGTKQQGLKLLSPKVTGAIAAVVLAAFAVVSYGLDVAEYKRLNRVASTAKFKDLVERQTLITNIARERPDLLELMIDLNSSDINGLKLGSLHFRRGQLASIGGDVQNEGQLYSYDKFLKSNKNMTKVEIQNSSVDTRSKRIKFTINFHYKTFTKKSITR